MNTMRTGMKSTGRTLTDTKHGMSMIKTEMKSTVRPLTEANHGTNILIDRTEQ